MEKSLMEPLVESMGPEDGRQEEFSEVKLHLANVVKCSVNPGYQNRDFRNRNGTSVVDPDFYHMMQFEVFSVYISKIGKNIQFLAILATGVWAWVFKQSVIWSNGSPHYRAWGLFHGLLDAYLSLPLIKSAPRFVVGSVLVAVILLFHIVSIYVFFKYTDSRLRDILEKYHHSLKDESGVTLGTSECSHPFREWNDDSGITLRHARRFTISVDNDALDDESAVDGVFPPIYIYFDIPGNVHIGETNYDASMKIGACNWALLQSTHKEVIQTPAFFMATCLNWLFLNLMPVTLAYTVLVSSYHGSMGGPNHMSMFVSGLVMFLIFFVIMMFNDNYRHRTFFYQEVTQRVNRALQKDVNTTDLTLAFYDKGRLHGFGAFENPFQRYQFVPRVVVDAATKEIDKSNNEAWWRDKYQ